MIPLPDRKRYKRLKVAVRGYTEGFTSVMWTANEELAVAALTSSVSEYEIDFLKRTITPTPYPLVSQNFFEYRDLEEWFDAVGSALHFVLRFQMRICYDLASIEDCGSLDSPAKIMVFHASTEIEADNGAIYRHHRTDKVWFQFPPNTWSPAPEP